MDNNSIYKGKRLAQPDEVTNYRTGGGLEKAFVLANIVRKKEPGQNVRIIASEKEVLVESGKKYKFKSTKGLRKQIQISKKGEINVV
jgi:hypothetical protein